MDKKEPIKISLKMAIIIIIIVLAIIGGIIYFVYSNSVKKEDTLIEQTEQIITEQGKNCTTNTYTYMTYKKLPKCNDLDYDILIGDFSNQLAVFIRSNKIKLDNALIKSKEELNEYFDVFFEADNDYLRVGVETELGWVHILDIIEEFDDEYFENNNLAINAGPYQFVSANIQNGIETINFSRTYNRGVTALPEYFNFITLGKDVDKVNFDIYAEYGDDDVLPIDATDEIMIEAGYKDVIVILLIIIVLIIVLIIIHKSKKKVIKAFMISLLLIIILYFIATFYNETKMMDDKPIIYLYPIQETEVNVKLEKSESITTSYPKYINGWNVKANVDGNLVDLDTGKNLYALYYENKSNIDFKITDEGFCVKGEDVTEFLEEKLKVLGLNDKETEEFIIYWLPKLEKNKYNYIRFATEEEINQNMPVDITPNPDTFIRVLMVYKPLNKKINVKEQSLNSVERKGFTAVEWGGTEIQ